MRRLGRRTAVLRILAVASCLALLLGGCWSGFPDDVHPELSRSIAPSPSSATSSRLRGDRPLVTVETHGGECAAGECREVVRVDADGTLHRLQPPPELVRTVPAELIDALEVEIERANFALIESRPFRETCPTAYDGQETVYTFHLVEGDEVLPSCRFALDPNHPLFQAVTAAVALGGSSG